LPVERKIRFDTDASVRLNSSAISTIDLPAALNLAKTPLLFLGPFQTPAHRPVLIRRAECESVVVPDVFIDL
jgi:hypothetical protein